MRERPEDIPLLAQHALDWVIRKLNIPPLRFSRADLDRLLQYAWPGNVRELENAIERAAILARDGQMRLDLPGTGRERALPRQPERTARPC